VAELIEFTLAALLLLLLVVGVLARHLKLSQLHLKEAAPPNALQAQPIEAELAHSDASQLQAQQSMHEAILAHASAFRAQLQELEADRDKGLLSEEEFAKQHDEMARRLLEDTQALKLNGPRASTLGNDSVHPSIEGKQDPEASKLKQALAWAGQGTQLAGSLGLVFLVGAFGLYAWLGQPKALDPLNAKTQTFDESSHAQSPQELKEMVEDIQSKLKTDPNSWEAWLMLARVQRTREDYEASDLAFQKALSLSENDDIQIERAEVLALKNHGSFEGEAQAIIDQVLKANPDQPNALLLAGSAAFSTGNFKLALQHWTRVRAQVDENSEEAQSLDQVIHMAQQKLGIKVAESKASAPSTKASSTSMGVQGRVSIAQALMKQVAPSDTVFIYANDPQGSRMPLAIMKVQVKDLPMAFNLNDDLAMSPAKRISQYPKVMVHARVSKSGQAMPEPGDFGVTLGPIDLGAKGVELKIEGPNKP
jgi:cytochrome c-type biogenesis protein CcmH